MDWILCEMREKEEEMKGKRGKEGERMRKGKTED